jgi:hypothetical protein
MAGLMTRRILIGALAGAAVAGGFGLRGTLADGHSIEVVGTDGERRTWTADDLANLPQTDVSGGWTDSEEGAEFTARGPLLAEVVLASQPQSDPETAARYAVVVIGADGYRAVYGWGELAPEIGAAPVVLALEFDGEPLRDEFRPAWVVSAADRSSPRSVFGVSRIEVRDLGENPGMATPEA